MYVKKPKAPGSPVFKFKISSVHVQQRHNSQTEASDVKLFQVKVSFL